MRIGVKLNNHGPEASRVLHFARVADEAGYTSGWLSDRLVNPEVQGSDYPFTPDNSVPWPTDVDFYEVTATMAAVAAVTNQMEVASGVLVLPYRNPVIVAKQLASIDALSGGRVIAGIGVGWMAEEFKAAGAPFKRRGARTDEGIAVLRNLWQGRSPGFEGEFFEVPAGSHCFPVPAHEIPIVIGGMTDAALRRAGRIGDGWMGIKSLAEYDQAEMTGMVDAVRGAAADAGRDPAAQRCVLSVPGDPAAVAEIVPQVQAAGIDELILHPPLENVEEARAALELVSSAVTA